MSVPCLSSSVAGRPLRPATRLSLGEPLPHQLADRPRANLKTPGLAVPGLHVLELLKLDYSVLATISRSYPQF